ncbi:TPA: ead/Ea22-like family protein [Raoultella ornithinolytica]
MTDITELAQSLKAAAEPISSGYSRNWIVSHDDETCWVGANDDDGNLTPFIEVSIADWSGNKADNEKLARFIALCRPANVLTLVEALEKANRRIAELERQQETLRPVGVMSEKAFHRLENSESRFIALWPRPGVYLPRKRPLDGVIVYARTAVAAATREAE